MTKLPISAVDLATLCAPTIVTVHLDLARDDEKMDDLFDAMDSAYQAERDRWCCRYNRLAPRGGRWELVRNSSPHNDINADEYFEITGLTKRECNGGDSAETWLDAYAGRAAMRKALGALRKC